MGYLLIILFAVWNGLVIRWKHRNSKEDSNKWHAIGWWTRVAVLLLMYQCLMPIWYQHIMNPVTMMNNSIQAGVLTFLLVFGLSYWVYNFIINEINGWNWFYNETNMNKNVYKLLLLLWGVGTIAWGIWGDNLIINLIHLRN